MHLFLFNDILLVTERNIIEESIKLFGVQKRFRVQKVLNMHKAVVLEFRVPELGTYNCENGPPTILEGNSNTSEETLSSGSGIFNNKDINANERETIYNLLRQAFKIHSPNGKLQLVAPSIQARKEWVDDLTKVILEQEILAEKESEATSEFSFQHVDSAPINSNTPNPRLLSFYSSIPVVLTSNAQPRKSLWSRAYPQNSAVVPIPLPTSLSSHSSSSNGPSVDVTMSCVSCAAKEMEKMQIVDNSITGNTTSTTNNQMEIEMPSREDSVLSCCNEALEKRNKTVPSEIFLKCGSAHRTFPSLDLTHVSEMKERKRPYSSGDLLLLITGVERWHQVFVFVSDEN